MLDNDINSGNEQLNHIWFCYPAKFNSPFRLISFQDKGRIFMRENKIEFEGRKFETEIENIKSLRRVRPRYFWINILINALIGFLMKPWYEFYFEPFSVVTFMVIVTSIIVWRLVWIEVRYEQDDSEYAVYLTDGGLFGWSALIFGVKRVEHFFKNAFKNSVK